MSSARIGNVGLGPNAQGKPRTQHPLELLGFILFDRRDTQDQAQDGPGSMPAATTVRVPSAIRDSSHWPLTYE